MYINSRRVQELAARVRGRRQQPPLVVAEAVRDEQHRALVSARRAPGLRHLFECSRRCKNPGGGEQLVWCSVLFLVMLQV